MSNVRKWMRRLAFTGGTWGTPRRKIKANFVSWPKVEGFYVMWWFPVFVLNLSFLAWVRIGMIWVWILFPTFIRWVDFFLPPQASFPHLQHENISKYLVGLTFIHSPNSIDSGTNTQEMVAPQKLLWNPHNPLFLGFKEYFTFALQLFFYFSHEYVLTFYLKNACDPLESSEKNCKQKNVNPSKTSITETH